VAIYLAAGPRRLCRAPRTAVGLGNPSVTSRLLLAALVACSVGVAPALAQESVGASWQPPAPPTYADPAVDPGVSPFYVAAQPEALPQIGVAQEGVASAVGGAELNAVDSAVPPTNPEIAALLQRIEALEAAAAAKDVEPEPADEPANEPEKADPLAGWTDLSTEKWTVRLGGHMQADFIHWANTDPNIQSNIQGVTARDYFEFRRLRLLADGVGYGVYDFRIQIDIEPENGEQVLSPVTDIKDAYFSLNELPGNHRWRIGNFFVPFSLEQVTNDTNNIFMERSIPTQGIFAADREVGMAVYGHADDMNSTWAGGVFLDSISESLKELIDDNQGHRLSGRYTWLPYYDEPSNGRYLLHTGCGVLYTNDQDDAVRFRARPQIHEGPFLIESLGLPAGSYTTGNVELATVWGPFSVQSEAFLSNVNFIGAPSQDCYGAYIYGSWFLTGENRIYERFGQHGAQFARNVPYTNFFWVPSGVGWGAWEAKCRWSNLTLTEVDRGEYNDFTCGFNWYWSDRVRCMFDWIHPMTDVGTTPFGETTSDIIAMRFDFNF
jgi:phosphate-selective porin OprO/OprP